MTQRDKTTATPTVSIGMPVYNGGKHIREALDSLLAQTFSDFELIISDNASTDDTEGICREYAANDPRIRYVRQSEDRGALANFQFVLDEAVGEYFMWASDHDLWHPAFLSSCLALLLGDSSVVLCYPQTMWIGPEGQFLHQDPSRLDTRNLSPLGRFMTVIWKLYSNAVYGLARSKTLRRTRLVRYTVGADHVLLAELSLLGSFAQIDRPLYYRRKNRPDETRDQALARYLQTLWSAHTPLPPQMPYWVFVREIIAGMNHVFPGKMVILFIAAPIVGLRFSRLLLRDLHYYAYLRTTKS